DTPRHAATLSDGVERNILSECTIVDIVIVDTVQQDIRAGGALSVDVVSGAASGNADSRDRWARVVIRDVVGDPDQVVRVSGQSRKFADLRAGYQVGDFSVLSINFQTLIRHHANGSGGDLGK